MDPNLFGMSGGMGRPGGTAIGGMNPGAPRSNMPVGAPQQFGGAGGMQPSAPYMPNGPKPPIGGPQPFTGPHPQIPIDPTGKPNGAAGGVIGPRGNSMFGHSQGLGMGQGHNTMQPPIGMGPSQPMGQGMPPEVLAMLMQLFGSSQSKFGMPSNGMPSNWQDINRQNGERNIIGRWQPNGTYAQ